MRLYQHYYCPWLRYINVFLFVMRYFVEIFALRSIAHLLRSTNSRKSVSLVNMVYVCLSVLWHHWHRHRSTQFLNQNENYNKLAHHLYGWFVKPWKPFDTVWLLAVACCAVLLTMINNQNKTKICEITFRFIRLVLSFDTEYCWKALRLVKLLCFSFSYRIYFSRRCHWQKKNRTRQQLVIRSLNFDAWKRIKCSHNVSLTHKTRTSLVSILNWLKPRLPQLASHQIVKREYIPFSIRNHWTQQRTNECRVSFFIVWIINKLEKPAWSDFELCVC